MATAAITADTGGELETVLDPNIDPTVDDDALAAAVDAMIAGEEPPPEPEAPAATPAAAATPKPADPAAAAATDDEPEVVKAIRAREQAQKIRDTAAEDAKAEASRIIAEAKAEGEKLRAQIAADAEAARKALADQFRADPLRAINDLGVDKRLLVDGVVRADDPLYRLQQENAAIRAQLETMAKAPNATASEFTQWRQQQEQQQAAQARARTEQEFVSSAKADLPDLFAQMETSAAALAAAGIQGTPNAEQLLLQRGYQVAQEMERALGRVASNKELVQYMTHVERQRSATAQGAAGKPTVGRVIVTRSLSGQAASERRTAPRSDTPSRDDLAAEIDAMIADDRNERKAGRR